MPLPVPSDLPVAECLPRLLAALAAGPNAVLVAPPGAGKTTSVPLALLEEPWPAKAFLRMRLLDSQTDVVGRLANPLRTPRDGC